jgi:hypothetical protein
VPGIPIRLSASLASRAREAAEIQERSLTEQVEHWARLGQVVEAAVQSTTVARLKAASHDARLPRALDAADTAAGRRRAATAIAGRNPVRYGTTRDAPSKIVKVESRRARRSR